MIFYFTKILLKGSYKYLMLTFFSIAVGAFLFGGSISISRSVSNYFVSEGKTLVGGDIVLSAARPIDTNSNNFTEIFKILDQSKITISKEYSVQAVFKNKINQDNEVKNNDNKSVTNINTAAALIRAVEDSFPLYGEMLVEPNNFSLVESGIYAEKSFLDKLSLKVGQSVILGDQEFKVLGTIIKEPDAISFGVSFTPKVIMLISDFEKSSLDLSQSRANYKVLIKENTPSYLSADIKKNIQSFAKENKIRYDDSTNGPNNFVRGLDSVKSFVGIVLAISLFLVIVNIITNLTYIISKFKKTIAIMKTFGATNTQIQIIYSLILGLIGLASGLIGSYFGAIVSNYLLPSISSFTQNKIEGISVLPTVIFGGFIGLIVILAAALPFFRSLSDISAKQLLANVSYGMTTKRYSSILLYVPIPFIISGLLYILSGDINLVAYSILGLIFSFVLFVLLSYFIIKFLYKFRNNLPFIIRSVIASLSWRGYEAVIIIASIMTALSGVFIISAIEKNILVNINQNVSNRAPALYLVDITKSQIQDVKDISGDTFVEYPIIRGRLLEVNARDMTLSTDRSVTREFNMTYRSDLLSTEKIISGQWHGNMVQNSVSIDDSFADDLGGVNVGDRIKVFIQGLNIEATITSIRSADRSSGTPFFYLVFSPDMISSFPASYFGSVDASPQDISKIKSELGVKYPNIIPIETSSIFKSVSALIDNIVLAVKIIGVPSIILGLILVFVMTGQSIYERRGDVLVFRAFGLSSKSVLLLFILEIVSLVLIASVTAYLLSHLIAYGLNKFLFSFDIFVFDTMSLLITSGIIVSASIFAYIISKTLTTAPLKNLLAEK